MIALLLAVQLIDAASATLAREMPAEVVSSRSAAHVIVVPRRAPATSCPGVGIELAAAKAARSPGKVQPLNALPKANYEIAVNRLIGGCPAPVIVSYQVGK